ncbi:MAG TPA: mechanosensitive ion channel family protein [Candidatus Cybelea sp.]|nr:mechanosensitive ion channel family protein [Candidatus Cybelea sp.]
MLKIALLLATLPILAQVPGVPLSIPGVTTTASPWGFPIKRVNNLDTAPIAFEGQRLFVVAAPAAAADAAIPPIVQRVDTIADNLQRIVPATVSIGNRPASHFDAKTFKVNIGSENGYPTLYATDASKREVAPIVTLTEADATLNSMSKNDLAVQWQGVLQSALGRALLTAEPEYFAAQLRKLPFVLAGGALATILLVILRRRLRRRNDALDATAEAVDPHETSDSAGAKQIRIERSVVSGGLLLTRYALVGMWAVIFLWVLGILPTTHALANVLTTRSIRVVVLWLILALLDRVLNVTIVRIADNWESSLFATPGDRARLTVRRPTVVRAAENLKSIVLWAIAILATLSILSVSAASVLTIGAVIAFALSFATQSLIKDYLNGFLILAEDQFAIGDVVTINGFSGTVEDLTLRITRIRTDDGRLVTLPNSSVVAVENQTRLWSRIDYRVAVAASSDIAKAIEVLTATLDEIARDPAWSKSILEPPQVLGVDAVSHAGIVLRAWIKTVPVQKAALMREINRRVSDAFRAANVSLGMPHAVVVRGASRSPQGQEASPEAQEASPEAQEASPQAQAPHP